jgi:TIR domain
MGVVVPEQRGPIEVFFSYARADEKLRRTLETHLSLMQRQGLIGGWSNRQVVAGADSGAEIDAHLNAARIILLLVSPDFLASDYCWGVEVKRALERHQAGEARVIPIILRPVDWLGAPFGRLEPLPQDGKPVTSWASRDQAFADIAQGIRQALTESATSKPPLPAASVLRPPANHLDPMPPRSPSSKGVGSSLPRNLPGRWREFSFLVSVAVVAGIIVWVAQTAFGTQLLNAVSGTRAGATVEVANGRVTQGPAASNPGGAQAAATVTPLAVLTNTVSPAVAATFTPPPAVASSTSTSAPTFRPTTAPASATAPTRPTPATPVGGHVDVNSELDPPSVATCYSNESKAAIPKMIVSLISVDRQADGRMVWHVGFLNHAAVPVMVSLASSPYVVAGDDTKYSARPIDDVSVEPEERKTFDVISQQPSVPAGDYRLFFVAHSFNLAGASQCVDIAWSAAPVRLP